MNITRPLASLEDTKKIAQTLGLALVCGDVVTLAGDMGAGKTTFAQFLIESISEAPVEVTSPTFNLLQTYPVKLSNGKRCELFHYDLYRIEHPSALVELGLEDAVAQLALIEWPDRLAGLNIPIALALSFTLANDGSRSVTIRGDAARWSTVVS